MRKFSANFHNLQVLVKSLRDLFPTRYNNFLNDNSLLHVEISCRISSRACRNQGLNFIAAIAVEGEQNAVDHCGNDGNFLPYSIIFILFTVNYYFDTWIQMLIKLCVNLYFISLSLFRKKNTKEIRKHVSSLSTIQSNNKIKFLLQ
jgi:hypothetical protein